MHEAIKKSISDVVFFILGDFPVPEFYELTLWNTQNTPNSLILIILPAYTAYEDGNIST
jgi:hypothetical protein